MTAQTVEAVDLREFVFVWARGLLGISQGHVVQGCEFGVVGLGFRGFLSVLGTPQSGTGQSSSKPKGPPKGGPALQSRSPRSPTLGGISKEPAGSAPPTSLLEAVQGLCQGFEAFWLRFFFFWVLFGLFWVYIESFEAE